MTAELGSRVCGKSNNMHLVDFILYNPLLYNYGQQQMLKILNLKGYCCSHLQQEQMIVNRNFGTQMK